MDDLKKLYSELGFQNIRTFIQSGNVIFDSPLQNTHEISLKIVGILKSSIGMDVPVVIRTMPELEEIIANNPFKQEDQSKINVIFLNDIPKEVNFEKAVAAKGDSEKFAINGKELYIYYSEGVSNSKLTVDLFEKCLKVTATIRNINTVNRLLLF